MTPFILHHYPPSPVAEKVRAAFGFKGLAWASVEQSRLPPRPELFAMTGGYRRIPVMQIGAELYCDSQVILAEIEARAPAPTLFPGGLGGLPLALARWSDNELFQLGFRLAFAPMADRLPPALVADRARLYLGPGGDVGKELADLPHTLAQLRAQYGWLDERLAHGPYLMGETPSCADLQLWWFFWFLRERYEPIGAFLEEFPHLVAWAGRMQAIGHGEQSAMTPAEALAIAKAATPETPVTEDPRDPQGLKPGMTVEVGPLGDSGEAPVRGVLRAVSRSRLALTVESAECGETVVHFPRVGYRASPLP